MRIVKNNVSGNLNLPAVIGAPATRELPSTEFTSLKQLTGVSRKELLKSHSIRPKANCLIEFALAEAGMELTE